jgi:glyoxylase-like metal-dependent hydrolase (beta-lactamase superfamily II)
MYRNSNVFNSIQIKPNLYYYVWQGMGNNCNTSLFTNVLSGNKPHVMIDPGHINNEFNENCFSNLAKAMEKDGFKIDDVGMIINTHSHADHCQANELLVKNNGIVIAMSEEEEQFRHSLGKTIDAMFGMRPPEFDTGLFIKEGTFNLGENGVKLEVYLCPGHSPGSICLYWPEHKTLITGDVVFFGSIGRTDFPGGNTNQLKNSIDRLAKLDVDCLLPGHSTELGNVIQGESIVQKNFQAIQTFF